MTHIWRQILKPPERYLVDLTSREFPQVDLEAFATALSHEDGYSLDAFVETHPRFLAVGKVGIARALIPCEADSHLSPLRQDGWHRYFFNQMFGRLDEADGAGADATWANVSLYF